MISKSAQPQTFRSRCALTAGGTPAVPVKSLSSCESKTVLTEKLVRFDDLPGGAKAATARYQLKWKLRAPALRLPLFF